MQFIVSQYNENLFVSIYTLFLSFVDFIRDKSDSKHYTEKIREFYNQYHVEMSGNIPVVHWLDDGSFSFTPLLYIDGKNVCSDFILKGRQQKQISSRNSNKRATFRNFDWQNLYDSCKLFQLFWHGKQLTYSQFLHIARNICGADKGKHMFLTALDDNYKTDVNWREILNAIIKRNVPLQKCMDCCFAQECCHSENMLETANPKRHDVKITAKQEYVSIEEAEESFKELLGQAVNSEKNGIHILKAQTGIGKTNTLIHYLKTADMPCVIAVPTHELKDEIYNKARNHGIENICCTPTLPEQVLSPEIMSEINHLFNIGAGQEVLRYLRTLLSDMNKSDKNYDVINEYLISSKQTVNYKGHIITTHAKLLTVSSDSFEGHQIIIDEDILRQVINTATVPVCDIRNVLYNKRAFKGEAWDKLYSLTHSLGYNIYDEIIEYGVNDLKGVNSNIYGLLKSSIIYANPENVIFIDCKKLFNRKIIIMSATIDCELYKAFFRDREIISYECKKAKYKGKLIQHTDASYSRFYFQKNKDKINYLKHITKEKVVITFKDLEERFNSRYHFGNIEGLNALEGKDIAVIGLPNLTEEVYVLYGICAGVVSEK